MEYGLRTVVLIHTLALAAGVSLIIDGAPPALRQRDVSLYALSSSKPLICNDCALRELISRSLPQMISTKRILTTLRQLPNSATKK